MLIISLLTMPFHCVIIDKDSLLSLISFKEVYL